MKIQKARSVSGTLRLPGDKSISHRAAMFAAIARGETKITNFAASEDCASTLACMRDLGVAIEQSGNDVTVRGVGKSGLQTPVNPLDCGNSGTTMRLLSGILAGQPFESVLIGDASLSKRPMMRVIKPLGEMGCKIASEDGRAPLRIGGRRPLRHYDHKLSVASAQIKSCILLAGLFADGITSVVEPTPTRDHTERMLRWLGVDVAEETITGGTRISVSGDAELAARPIDVPSDISSAAFFIAAAAALEGSSIRLENVGLNPSRTAVLDAIKSFGADITINGSREAGCEPAADIAVRGGLDPRLSAEKHLLSGAVIANLIDEIPMLAVLGTQLGGGLEVRDAAELRVKESDRISAVVSNLKRMNARVEEYSDGFRVWNSDLRGADIDSFGDHRIAMAFAVAGLFADGETTINDSECAAVSFPSFFETLENVRT